MSGGTLPRTGAGILAVGGASVTVQNLFVVGAIVVAVGIVLVAATVVRFSFRRQRAVGA